jgi:hypothetical protein
VNAERTLAGIAVRCAVFGGVVLLAAVPVYVYVEPWWRPVVARLAAALVLGTTLLQLRGALVDHLARGGASALDEARSRRGRGPGVPHHLEELVSVVRAALRSRRQFEEVLWPRLTALASRPLDRPSVRRGGRGPSVAGLRAAIGAAEKQP